VSEKTLVPMTLSLHQRSQAKRVYDFLIEHPYRHDQSIELGHRVELEDGEEVVCGSAGCLAGYLALEIILDGKLGFEHELDREWTTATFEGLVGSWMIEHEPEDWDPELNKHMPIIDLPDATDVISSAYSLTPEERQDFVNCVYNEEDLDTALSNFAVLFGLEPRPHVPVSPES
jgi:hypothetical protein